MKLHYKPGACSLSSHIVLNEGGLTFELDKTDTTQATTQTGEDFLRISPNGYVPALVMDDGEVLTENPAILQYLAGLAPDSHLAPPADSLARVRLQELLNFVSSELHKAFSPFFSGQELDPEQRINVSAQVGRRVGHIEARLEDGRSFLLGDHFTVADAYAFVVLNWSGPVGLTLEAWPKTQAYVGRIRERPAVRKAMVAEGLIQEGVAS